ncbi:hypothetical protein PO909_014962 [Leuciscus waleckii]
MISKKFLRFAFGGEAYQYRVPPFGLALSPRTFNKCMDAALAPLRLLGDWLFLAQSQELAVWHRDVVLAHIQSRGTGLRAGAFVPYLCGRKFGFCPKAPCWECHVAGKPLRQTPPSRAGARSWMAGL